MTDREKVEAWLAEAEKWRRAATETGRAHLTVNDGPVLARMVRAMLELADHFKQTQAGYDGWTDGSEIERRLAEALGSGTEREE